MKKYSTYLFILSLFIIISCSPQEEKPPFNLNGGPGRTNSYEAAGSFYTNNFFITQYSSPDSSGIIVSPLPLDGGKLIIATIGGSVLLVEGKKTGWITKLDSSLFVVAGMAADNNQNIYLIANNGLIYSYSSEGKLRWKYYFSKLDTSKFIFSDLLAQRDGIVVTLSPGIIFKLSYDGKLLWQDDYLLQTTKSFAATQSGKILIPATFNTFGSSDSLICYSPTGKKLWKKGFEKSRILRNPVIHRNMILIPATYDIYEDKLYLIYALDTLGNILWKKELSVLPRNISVGDDGKIYVTGYNAGLGEGLSGIFCFTDKGELIWKQYLDVTIPAPVLISKDNVAVVGVKKRSPGVFFFNNTGILIKTVSLSDAPIFNLQPFVLPDPVIAFAGTEKLFILRIDDSMMNKILPW